ncbi:MAG TPA: hypothetical protein VHF23_07235 [Gaiellaceae bacterium]|nr:hypothetical protein [Gaiellaceae bacterium]
MEEPARPDVILDVVFEEGLLFLSLRNLGTRPALAVSTEFARPLEGLGGTKDVAALPLFRRLEFLAPGREVRTLLDTSASWFGRRQPTKLSARIAYRDERGERYASTVKHDLAVYREVAYVARR